MAIIYNPNKKIFTLHTAHTTYQMQVDPLGYLLHLYYGEKTNSSMDYVLTYADRGFSGNPYAAGMNRTYSLDALPQEYPSLGTGDYRNIALNIKNEKGVESADLLFKSYEIRSGKYQLQGLPAVWADENEAQTLEIVLADENAQVEVHLLYGVLEETDVITRSVRIKNTGTGQITIEKAAAACLDFVQGEFEICDTGLGVWVNDVNIIWNEKEAGQWEMRPNALLLCFFKTSGIYNFCCWTNYSKHHGGTDENNYV